MLKFASQVKLFSKGGETRVVHREEAQRLHREKQAEYRGVGKFVRELFLPDRLLVMVARPTEDSCRSVYRETLNGGSDLFIEAATTIQPRKVTTQPCHAFKMKHEAARRLGF